MTRPRPAWSITGEALKAHSVGSAEFSLAGRSTVGAYAPVASVGGAVLIVQPYDEAYWAAIQMKRMTWIALVIVAAVAIGAATFLAKNLTSPILALSRAADLVAHGDFTGRVDIKTGDELQELGDTFNRMTDKLRQYAEMQVDKIVAEQRKTEAILFSINDGILMTDPEGKIRLANRKALEFFGLASAASLDGKTVAEAVPTPKLRDAVSAVLAEPAPEGFREVNLSTDKHHRVPPGPPGRWFREHGQDPRRGGGPSGRDPRERDREDEGGVPPLHHPRPPEPSGLRHGIHRGPAQRPRRRAQPRAAQHGLLHPALHEPPHGHGQQHPRHREDGVRPGQALSFDRRVEGRGGPLHGHPGVPGQAEEDHRGLRGRRGVLPRCGLGHGRARVHEPAGQRHQVHPSEGRITFRLRRGRPLQVRGSRHRRRRARGLPGQDSRSSRWASAGAARAWA